MTRPERGAWPRTITVGTLVAALTVAVAGCGGPPPITKELYEEALKVDVQKAGDKLIVVTRVSPPAEGYYESRQILVSGGGEPVPVGPPAEGGLGNVSNPTATIGTFGQEKKPASEAKEVVIRSQVYQGTAKGGTPLFEVERRVPVTP